MTSLVAVPPILGTASLGAGVGELNIAGDCVVSFSANLVEGQSLALGLSEQTYCLRVFDNGTVAEGETRAYSIMVSSST